MKYGREGLPLNLPDDLEIMAMNTGRGKVSLRQY